MAKLKKLYEDVSGVPTEIIPITTTSAVYDQQKEQWLDVTLSQATQDATLFTKGVVQLSSAIDSTSEGMSATPKAVKEAYDMAQSAFTQVVDGKELIATAINDKGGEVEGSDSFLDLAQAIINLPSGLKASGSYVVTTATLAFQYSANATNVSIRYIEVDNLDFEPELIFMTTNTSTPGMVVYENLGLSLNQASVRTSKFNGSNFTNQSNVQYKSNAQSAYVNSTGFRLPVGTSVSAGETLRWVAIGGLLA